MRRMLYENGLSLAFIGLFGLCAIGQTVTGQHTYNEDREAHGQSRLSYLQYLRTGHCLEGFAENWESEFLQMGVYVLLTAFLRQKGSPESKTLVGEEAVDRDPRRVPPHPEAPWPVRRGGLVLTLYSHSLTLVLVLLFVGCFGLHALGGAWEYSADQVAHGDAPVSMVAYLGTARFWYESLQNWQSEFLSLAVMIVLAIFLRQRGSPESKPVDHPHRETGRE